MGYRDATNTKNLKVIPIDSGWDGTVSKRSKHGKF